MISARLKKIGDMVTTNHVIDVGCDHSLLGIYLASKHIYTHGTDINPHAIEMSLANIKKYQVSQYVTASVNDGLNNIGTTDATIVISGLGTHTILNIIGDKKFSHLIISAHNDLELLRTTLTSNGYKIIDEKTIKDANKYYCIISFIPGVVTYTEEELRYGPIIIRNPKDNKDYLKYLMDKKQEVLGHVPEMYLLKKDSIKDEVRYLSNLINNI